MEETITTFHCIKNIRKGTIYSCNRVAGSVDQHQYMATNYNQSEKVIIGPPVTKLLSIHMSDYVKILKQKKRNIIIIEHDEISWEILKPMIIQAIIEKLSDCATM